MIDSIRDFYPKLRIIIADDSINFKEINRENVDQFKMPQAIGFNNGKNLAISQVHMINKKLKFIMSSNLGKSILFFLEKGSFHGKFLI